MNKEFESKFQDAMHRVLQNNERLIEAWVAETGVSPKDSVLIQQNSGNEIRFWVRAKTEDELKLERLHEDVRERIAKIRLEPAGSMQVEEFVGGLIGLLFASEEQGRPKAVKCLRSAIDWIVMADKRLRRQETFKREFFVFSLVAISTAFAVCLAACFAVLTR